MDPVDRTFDTVYYWSQRAQRAANSVVDGLVATTNTVADAVSSAVASTTSSSRSSSVITGSASGPSWSFVGLKTACEKHKLATGATVLAALGGVGYLAYRQGLLTPPKRPRRRAHRLANGARKDVVLIIGSVAEPLTRYIAHDLETRGFIVYITSRNTKADQKFFQHESIQDIKSLVISPDPADVEFNAEQLRKFDFLLSSDHIPFQGAEPNKLELVGIIFVPEMYYPAGKFSLIPTQTWTKTLNDSALLPLSLLMNGLIGIAEKYDSNMVFITPTLTSSLQLPYHSLENITVTTLQQIASNLAHDYETLNITNLRLGAVNIHTNNSRKNLGLRGESIKTLHHTVFDLLYNADNAATVYVGSGARFLSTFGGWVPRWLVRNYLRHYFARE